MIDENKEITPLPKRSRRTFLKWLGAGVAAATAASVFPLPQIAGAKEEPKPTQDNPAKTLETAPPFNKTQYLNELSGEQWQRGQELLGSLSKLYKALNCEPIIDIVKVVDESIMLAQNPNVSTTRGSAGITAVVNVANNQSTIAFSQFNNPNSIRETALHEFCHLVDPEQKIVNRVLTIDEIAQFTKKRDMVMELYCKRFLMNGLFAERRDYDVLNNYSLSSMKSYLENSDTHPDPTGAKIALVEAQKEAFAEFGKQALIKPNETRRRFPEFVELFEGIYQKVSGFTLEKAQKDLN